MKCPRCDNEDELKITLYKDKEDFQLLRCEICDFKWGISKDKTAS